MLDTSGPAGSFRFGVDDIGEAAIRDIRHYTAQAVASARKNDKAVTVHFQIINRGRFGAYSTISENQDDLVAIDERVPAILLGAFRALLSDPAFMQSKRSCTSTALKFDESIEQIWADPHLWGTIAPLPDELGERMAQALAYWGTNYCLFHEVRHLLAGHNDWRQNASKEWLTPGNLQTLEWSADCGAAADLLAHLLQPVIRKADDRIMWNIPGTNRLGTRQDALEFAGLVVFVCHLFMADAGKALDEENTEYHPPQLLRQQFGLAMLVDALILFARIDPGEVAPILVGITGEATNAIQRMFPGASAWRMSRATWEAGLRAKERYEVGWAELRPLLEPYVRVGTLPPADPVLIWDADQPL